ncbi:hypothetical protein [Grimontia sp. NTOU-MAR1]|uniref:hypothetical protein n=1 Tax=Grimontia sp. NTOU-MAR1 TaxID=3111011 RepID=UPI002DBA97E0|nr:hypothetical protein [Grimontia sp. NTOU-MAR1]WRV96389.1 hypothetical protein VP504_09625 [Grimontia sp. NTOU-MAR1]
MASVSVIPPNPTDIPSEIKCQAIADNIKKDKGWDIEFDITNSDAEFSTDDATSNELKIALTARFPEDWTYLALTTQE